VIDGILGTAQRLMELEVEGLTGAAHGERSHLLPVALPYRNYHRKLEHCCKKGGGKSALPA
jgi:hypothetical protein